jgi:hypothetical protein
MDITAQIGNKTQQRPSDMANPGVDLPLTYRTGQKWPKIAGFLHNAGKSVFSTYPSKLLIFLVSVTRTDANISRKFSYSLTVGLPIAALRDDVSCSQFVLISSYEWRRGKMVQTRSHNETVRPALRQGTKSGIGGARR